MGLIYESVLKKNCLFGPKYEDWLGGGRGVVKCVRCMLFLNSILMISFSEGAKIETDISSHEVYPH